MKKIYRVINNTTGVIRNKDFTTAEDAERSIHNYLALGGKCELDVIEVEVAE